MSLSFATGDLKNARVVKVGGSLLDLPDLAPRLLSVLETDDIVVVGGGVAADVVRDWDQRFRLTADVAHRLAIRAMSLNAALVAATDSAFNLALSVRQLLSDVRISPGIYILDTESFIHELERMHRPLEPSWDVTSDSIAAWMADCLGISRLLLLKSTDVPAEFTTIKLSSRNIELSALVAAGSVDNRFPEHAAEIQSILWCNLRSEFRRTVQIRS